MAEFDSASHLRRVEHVVSNRRRNLSLKRSLLIVDPHHSVAEPATVFGVVDCLSFLEIKRLNTFAFGGFPESAAEEPDVDDSRRAHASKNASPER